MLRIKSATKDFILYLNQLRIYPNKPGGWVTVGNGDLFDYGFTVEDIKSGIQVTFNNIVILEIKDHE